MANLRQPSTASATLGDILGNRFAPVQESLFKALGHDDEARLSQVSKELSMTSKRFRDRNRILGNFFSDPKAFRSLQAQTNTFVAGDIVLDFFARTKKFLHNNPLLGLIIPSGNDDDVHGFLEDDGYFLLEDESFDRSRYYDDCYAGYEHPTRTTDGENRVQIVLCYAPYSPVPTLIADMTLDTTLSHNFVTWNKAYSLFPYQTFVEKQGYFLMPGINVARGHEVDVQLRALAAAGYKLKDLAWHDEQNKVLARRRRCGDQQSWIINLPTDGVTASQVPDGVIASAAFRVHKVDDGDDDPNSWEGQTYCKGFGAMPLTSPVLRYSYMLQYTKDSKYEKKIKFLERRLHGLTMVELVKLPESERPPNYDDAVWNASPLTNFDVPSYWTYHDDEVIKYLNRLEEELGEDEK